LKLKIIRKTCFSSVSGGVDVIATVFKEAKGVILWITEQGTLGRTSVLHQEG
jgi:hypothetical protein